MALRLSFTLAKNGVFSFIRHNQYASTVCIPRCASPGNLVMRCYKSNFTHNHYRVMSKVAADPQAASAASGNGSGKAIQKYISALATKRPTKKKAKHVDEKDLDKDVIEAIKFKVWAYATAESYNLETLAAALREQGLYNVFPNPEDMLGVLRVTAAYPTGDEPREILFFSDGVSIFWNVGDTERSQVLKFLRKHQEDSYDTALINHEADFMEYLYSKGNAKLSNGRFLLQEEISGNELLKYTFSNAIAVSVKLAIWEASLDNYIESMKWVVDDMKEGKKIQITKPDVLRKTGELFTLKHLINLGSNSLDEPDFYWDREALGAIFKQTSNFFNIDRRTKVMNEKLSHCCELTDLLTSHLSDKHHVRLEWFIIALIAIEVIFELSHFAFTTL